MKHLRLCILMIVLLVNHTAHAGCDLKKIRENPNGTFTYPLTCHLEFGRLYKTEQQRKKELEHLRESVKLQDLAIDRANIRIKKWQDTTYKMEDRLIRTDRNNDKMKWIYFGLGILIMGGATYGASRLR